MATKFKYIMSTKLNNISSTFEIGNDSLHRILGLWWDPQHDVFQFTIKNLEEVIKEVPTKRGVLKHLMSVYDPLGLLACFVVRGKILMQDIWRAGIDWDQELPQNLKQKWFLWVDNLKHIMNLKVPRCYSLLIPVAEKIQLHTFCDASEKAFAAVVYLRVETKEQIDVVLIISKTRVAPLKPLSIPRLELQAAVMASRLITKVKEELEIRAESCYLWSDSKCVLSWIRADGRKFKPFVAHRVGEIQQLTDGLVQWRWIPTRMNVADEATRVEKENDEVISKRWFEGPDFLKGNEEIWPKEENVIQEEQTNDELEMKKEFVMNINENHLILYQEGLPEIKKFSKVNKLLRTSAWILRWRKKYKLKKENGSNLPSELTVEELKEVEKYWEKLSQLQSFEEEIRDLQNGKRIKRTSRLYNINPKLKDGLLVLEGRIDLAPCISMDVKNPVILCHKHTFIKMVIQNIHEKLDLEDYSVGQASLEQVFLTFTKKQVADEEVEIKKGYRAWCC